MLIEKMNESQPLKIAQQLLVVCTHEQDIAYFVIR